MKQAVLGFIFALLLLMGVLAVSPVPDAETGETAAVTAVQTETDAACRPAADAVRQI